MTYGNEDFTKDKLQSSDHSLYRNGILFNRPQAGFFFLNDLISKNPVYIYLSVSNWLQGAKVVENFDKTAVENGKNISLRVG